MPLGMKKELLVGREKYFWEENSYASLANYA